MKSVGKIIRSARHEKNLSVKGLAEITKIKREFILFLEKEEWDKLPEYAVVTGFVKNIAGALELNPSNLVAFLRRDYPPKRLPVNPKPDVMKEFSWNPKLTFGLGIGVVTVAVFSYLIFQYINFIAPPKLTLDAPQENQVITASTLKVAGKTDPDATVKVNNQPALLDDEGKFVTEIEVVEETKEVVVVSKLRNGKETAITRRIEVKLGG